MLAEVPHRQVRRKARLDQCPSGVGQQDLAAVGGGGDARGVMDVEADVFVADQRRLAGVQTDPDPDRRGARPLVCEETPLRRGGRDACVDRAREDAEK